MKRNPILALLLVFSLCSSACGEDVGLGTRSSSPSTTEGDVSDDQQPTTSSPSSGTQMEHTGQAGEHGEGDGDSGNGGASSSSSGEGSGGSSSDGGDKTSSEDGQVRGSTTTTGQPDCSGCAETSSFAARQIALQRVKVPGESLITRYQFMLTDTPGRLACMAIDDTRARPAGAGWQIFATFYRQEERGAPASCPVGEYLMTPGYSCSELFDELTPARKVTNMWCMVRRTWNVDGTVLSTEVAQAGLVTVREVEEGCRFDTEIVFNGDEHLFGVHILPEIKPSDPTCGYSL